MNGIPRRQVLGMMSLGGTMAFLQKTASAQQNQQREARPMSFHYGPDNPSETYVKHAYDEQTVDLGEVKMNYVVAGSADSPALLLNPRSDRIVVGLRKGDRSLEGPLPCSCRRFAWTRAVYPDARPVHAGQHGQRPGALPCACDQAAVRRERTLIGRCAFGVDVRLCHAWYRPRLSL